MSTMTTSRSVSGAESAKTPRDGLSPASAAISFSAIMTRSTGHPRLSGRPKNAPTHSFVARCRVAECESRVCGSDGGECVAACSDGRAVVHNWPWTARGALHKRQRMRASTRFNEVSECAANARCTAATEKRILRPWTYLPLSPQRDAVYPLRHR